jgi:serine/threonine protein phosphatase 1
MCDEEGYLQARYVRFMDNLLHYVELDDYFLVHGAFDFNSATPFATPKAMLWSKTHRHNPQMMGHKRLVHGHSTRTLEAILAAIAARAMVIPVDGGCAYTDTKRGLPNGSLGYLCAFNLDTWELRSQKNTESSI